MKTTLTLTLLLIATLALPSPSLGQDKLQYAREQYQLCRDLLESNEGCKALKACEDGLAAKDINVLKDLAVEARKLCRKQRRPKKPKCPTGQSVTQETKGHCCWSGQVWEGNACVGLPGACP